MKLTRLQLTRLIREQLLQEITPGIIDPSQGSASVPVSKDSEIDRSAADTAARQASYMTGDSGRIVLEIALGFTPVGIAVDTSYLAWALYNRDAVGAVWAGIGFIPFFGDAFKGFRKTLASGKKLSPSQIKTVEEAIAAVRSTEKSGEAAKLKAKASTSTAEARAAVQSSKSSATGAARATSTMSRAAAAKAADASRETLSASKIGQTEVLSQDLYVFLAANPGGRKIGTGVVSRSKGLSRLEGVEEVLEKARKDFAPGAVPRTDAVYLTPYTDAGAWRDWGREVFMVKIPKGSKVTFADGGVASEVAANLRKADPEEAAEYAEEYWTKGGTMMGADEILTQGRVEVVGKVDDLLSTAQIEKLSWRDEYRSAFK